MRDVKGRSLFGCASKCNNLNEVISLLGELASEDARKATVAFGMLLSANSTKGGVYRDDALEVLTKLSYAKAELDTAAYHTHPTIDVTSEILSNAQKYADEATIPCTEWPTPDEIIENVLTTAKKYAAVKEWRRFVLNDSGAVIGVKKIKLK